MGTGKIRETEKINKKQNNGASPRVRTSDLKMAKQLVLASQITRPHKFDRVILSF